MVFQCYPVEEVNIVRGAFGLRPLTETAFLPLTEPKGTGEPIVVNHDDVKAYLAEIGRIQGYISDTEYTLESTRLDVVWQRVERSVPTFVFEVQIDGDIYHAMSKLKHAFDLWNSHIFLVAAMSDRGKYQELLSGTFHEVDDHMRFIDVVLVKELLEKKRGYKEMERALGIFKR
jgi:hypothetical protein